MSEPKTKRNNSSVTDFLNKVENQKRREDSFVVMQIMEEITGEKPEMWGPSIIGFGTYTYKYKSGREGDWMLTGFSPRKQSLTLYIMSGFENYDSILSNLGKYKTGKSCLYVNRLEDIDLEVLRALISASVEFMKNYDHKQG